jgi:uncharacterized membrane protein
MALRESEEKFERKRTEMALRESEEKFKRGELSDAEYNVWKVMTQQKLAELEATYFKGYQHI